MNTEEKGEFDILDTSTSRFQRPVLKATEAPAEEVQLPKKATDSQGVKPVGNPLEDRLVVAENVKNTETISIKVVKQAENAAASQENSSIGTIKLRAPGTAGGMGLKKPNTIRFSNPTTNLGAIGDDGQKTIKLRTPPGAADSEKLANNSDISRTVKLNPEDLEFKSAPRTIKFSSSRNSETQDNTVNMNENSLKMKNDRTVKMRTSVDITQKSTMSKMDSDDNFNFAEENTKNVNPGIVMTLVNVATVIIIISSLYFSVTSFTKLFGN